MSPGWQSSTSHIDSKVVNRMAFALPLFRIDKFASVISIALASSFAVIFLSFKSLSRCMTTGMLNHQLLFCFNVACQS